MTRTRIILSITLIVTLYVINQTLVIGNAEIANTDDEVYVLWAEDTVLRTNKFPIGFMSESSKFNYSIVTSWGFIANKNVYTTSNPHIRWIQIPSDPESSSAIVSIFTNNEFRKNYTIEWDLHSNSSLLPEKISYYYFESCYWVGSSAQSAIFTPDGRLKIVYEVNDKRINSKALPYQQDFSFSVNDKNIWSSLSSYLLSHYSVGWRSWNFPSENYTGPIVAMFDGGEYTEVITIDWNDSSSTRFRRKVDDDGGTGARIYTSPDAEEFIDRISNYVKDYSGNYILSSKSIALPNLFFISLCIIDLLLILAFYRRKTDR